MKKRLVILISGRGSNMEAILRAAADPAYPGQVVAVIANRPDAKGLETAKAAGIATAALDHKAYPSREAFDAALAEAIDAHAPDLVILAGFMRILSEGFVRHYDGLLINIHPSLLPAFPGLHTHQRALEEGCRVHGCTVHFVTPALDHGPAIAQAVVPVLEGDDEHSLAARVLVQEHQVYPAAVAWFCQGRLRLEQGRVLLADNPMAAASALISPPARS